MSTKTLDELKAEFLAEQAELKHYGVAGMKWGKRKGSVDSRPTKEDVYNARASQGEARIKLGLHKKAEPSTYSNAKIKQLKSEIKETAKVANVAANKKELAAKTLAGAALVAGAIGYIGSKSFSSLPPGNLQYGAALMSSIGSAGFLGLATSAVITNAVAAREETKFHNS